MLAIVTQQYDIFSYYEPETSNQFGIIHYGSRVAYDTSSFLHVNRDQVPDDVLSMFSKHSCNFGFITHLFSHELRAIAGTQYWVFVLYTIQYNMYSVIWLFIYRKRRWTQWS